MLGGGEGEGEGEKDVISKAVTCLWNIFYSGLRGRGCRFARVRGGILGQGGSTLSEEKGEEGDCVRGHWEGVAVIWM